MNSTKQLFTKISILDEIRIEAKSGSSEKLTELIDSSIKRIITQSSTPEENRLINRLGPANKLVNNLLMEMTFLIITLFIGVIEEVILRPDKKGFDFKKFTKTRRLKIIKSIMLFTAILAFILIFIPYL